MYKIKIIVLIVISIFLSACADDYPTSGKLTKNTNSKSQLGEVSFNRYSGYIVELDASVIDEVSKVKTALKHYKNNKNFQVTPAQMSLLDADIIVDINDKYKQSLLTKDTVIQTAINDWQKIQDRKINQTISKDSEALKNKKIFDKYLSKPRKIVAGLTTEISNNKIIIEKISEQIAEKTNAIIINQKIDAKLLNKKSFSLKSKKSSWEDEVPDNCSEIRKIKYYVKKYPIEKYIVINQLSSKQSCIHITRPHKEVISDSYDKFVKMKYFEIGKYNNEQTKEKLEAAKEELNNAEKMAKNEIGKGYRKAEKQYYAGTELVASVKQAKKTATIDYINKVLDKGLNNANLFVDDAVKPHLVELTESIRKLKIDSRSLSNTYKNDISEAYKQLMISTVNESINNIVKIDENGDFTGLDGDFGIVAALVNIEASIGKDKNVKSKNLNYSKIININESHKLADTDSLNLTIDLNKLNENSKSNNFVKEKIAKYVVNLIR